MQAEHKYLIHLYDCGVRGLAPQPPEEPVSWEHILQLAKQQAVTGVICCALRRAEFCPAAIRLQCRKNAVSIAMLNKERTEAVMQTLKLLKAEGLHPAVIKGYDVARFYAIPESRTSADTDLLLPPEEEQKAYAVLEANGFRTTARKKGAHHGKASRSDTGTLELHAKLWSDRTGQTLFGKNAEKILRPETTVTVPFRDGEIDVLCAQNAMLFLSAHFVRHFIEPGAGLRQAYDLALYFSRNKDAFDTGIYWQQLHSFGFAPLISDVLSVLIEAGCFSAAEFPGLALAEEAVCRQLSDDLLSYGANGKEATRSKGVWDYYCAHRKAKSAGSALRVTGMRIRDRMETVFPKAALLEKRYPYLNGRHWLYPAAWVQRGVGALTDRTRREEAKQSLSMLPSSPYGGAAEAEARTELLHSVGLL